ncbi:hypothetical protein QP900_00050 [Corynebacterium marquesiae]|nr:hypothetical protein [Corynebacterium marquesiae]
MRHVGQAEFIDPARLTTIEELDGVIAEIGIQKVVNPDSFYDIPLKLAPQEFCAELEKASIPFSIVDDDRIILYEHWTKFFIEDEEIVNISWLNRDYYSDLDVIEMAFPSATDSSEYRANYNPGASSRPSVTQATQKTIVDPVAPVAGVSEKAWDLTKQVLPDAPAPGMGWDREILRRSTPEQLNRIIELLRPLTTASFEDPATRQFFAIATNLGATDLDITPIIDEAERYQESTDPVALEMIDNDQVLLFDVICPSNFAQLNRYLRLDGTALLDNQIEFLRKAARNTQFRTAPQFQWLSSSRFATIPESAYAISFIGQAGRILWDSAEEEDLIETLEAERKRRLN